VSARQEEDDVVIQVIDHGGGIPPAVLKRVFEPFFTTHENSLGLGLPIALHIVTEHGGKIRVEPLKERGTCISVVLPLGAHSQVR
jgi:signal transduction histidine kinase